MGTVGDSVDTACDENHFCRVADDNSNCKYFTKSNRPPISDVPYRLCAHIWFGKCDSRAAWPENQKEMICPLYNIVPSNSGKLLVHLTNSGEIVCAAKVSGLSECASSLLLSLYFQGADLVESYPVGDGYSFTAFGEDRALLEIIASGFAERYVAFNSKNNRVRMTKAGREMIRAWYREGASFINNVKKENGIE